jgi:transcriptional regulator with XRE-family HTH domain
MDDLRVGAAFRSVRIKHRWRQRDLAGKAKVSRGLISLIERGHLDKVSLGALRRVAAVLEIRIDVTARWRAGDLDRLLNAKHSALHESLARYVEQLPGWVGSPEVSFAVYGERGVIDILAWHASSRTLLVIELKTEIVDVQETIATLDRKRRLAAGIARERGWDPASVSSWLIVTDTRTNRRRVAAHQAMLRATLPHTGVAVRRWLRDPRGTVAGLSFWTDANPGGVKQRIGAVKRVRATITEPAAA